MLCLDEKDFFREATRRICGSLDIEKSLWNFFMYVREYIPSDIILILTYDPDVGIIEILAMANVYGGKITSIKSDVPPETQKRVAEMVAENEFNPSPFFMTTDRVSEHPILHPLADIVKDPDCAFLAIGPKPWLSSTGIFLGCHSEKYSKEHERLFMLLWEPIAIAIANYLSHREVLREKDALLDDNRYLRNELSRQVGEEIVGADFGLKPVMKMVGQVAPLSSPVLLLGETGVGKEIIATAIHNLSSRRNGPLIKVNCGAIPDSLMDSELFGHEKGAFTGAMFQKRGRFERAHGGTILLDEIGELTAGAQVRLLRVLQEKEFERVGGTTSIPVDTRVIAATHRNLEAMLADGKFREDLYFRLRVFPIMIPPLRERRADIPALVKYFIKKKSREMGMESIPNIQPEYIEKLINYRWPGNVRELQNVIERALIINRMGPLVFEDITEVGSHPKLIQPTFGDEDAVTLDQCITRHIMLALEKTGGRVEGDKGAARTLKINPSTLRVKMRKLGIPFGRQAQIKHRDPVL